MMYEPTVHMQTTGPPARRGACERADQVFDQVFEGKKNAPMLARNPAAATV